MDHPMRSILLGNLDVTAAIDRSFLGALGLRVLVLCALVIMIDGFDVQVITYVAPVLTKALGVDRSMLGPVFSSGLVGTMLGALVLAPLADRVGRKLVLCGCILVFALCSLGTITVGGIESLMIWRFAAGLGVALVQGGLWAWFLWYVAAKVRSGA